MLENPKKRIEELVSLLNRASYEYHTLDKPTITDQEYDKYLKELVELEEEYPELIREDSPTIRVGGEVIDAFQKVAHEKPRLSLSNVFNEDEIVNFDEKIKKVVKKPTSPCTVNKRRVSKS